MGRLVSLGQWEQHEALLPHSQSGGGKKALSRGIILCQTTGKRKSGKDRVTLACDGEGVNYWRTASGTSSINKQLPEAAWGREALYSTSEAESTAGIFKSLKKKSLEMSIVWRQDTGQPCYATWYFHCLGRPKKPLLHGTSITEI